ncbi:MAG: 2-dehydropantoate 2-reductase [Xanthobacteraceae bacterium]|jgi:2-dehydropantoate 2-reductase
MRILVVGAGALGGYFGGRLKEAGRDVTFLVRPRRAEQLAKTGLIVRSPKGDINIPAPPTVFAEHLSAPFDLILLSCKAYDLQGAMDSFAPAVGANTAILPLLNGMRHMDLLAARFGAAAVLGGQCVISATLDADGRILHLNDLHFLSFGEQNGAKSPRVAAIAADFSGAKFDSQLSTAILQEMWEKWAFIAAAAGISCLMRGAFGDIAAAGGSQYASDMFAECCAIAVKSGFAPGETAVKRSIGMLTAAGSPIAASMLRDIERGARIESDHIVGDLLQRGGGRPGDYPLLQIAYAHLRTYEARRQREQGATAAR